jgi:hypothetical protein
VEPHNPWWWVFQSSFPTTTYIKMALKEYYKELKQILESELVNYDKAHVFTVQDIAAIINNKMKHKKFLLDQIRRFISYKRNHFEVYESKFGEGHLNKTYIFLRRDFEK